MLKVVSWLIPLKTIAQSEFLSLVSLLISRFGKYPQFIDFFLSKNRFEIPNDLPSSKSELDEKVAYYLENMRKFTAEDNQKLMQEFATRDSYTPSIDSPPIAFLTSGPPSSLTNNVLNNISQSYQESMSMTLNQSFPESCDTGFLTADECANLLIQHKPKIIFFELHTGLGKVAENTIFSRDFIKEIKKQTGAKIYIICFDIWRDFDVNYIKYWASIADKFLHFDEISARKLGGTYPMYQWLYPGLNHTKSGSVAVKSGVFFQGSIREYDRRRLLVYTARLAKKYDIPYKFRTFPHHNSRKVPTEKNYLNSMNRAKYCLGMGQKSQNFWLVTFRSVESIAAGTILFQQVGPTDDPLSFFYKPFLHYLPFSTLADLEAIFSLCKFHGIEIEKLESRALIYHQAVFGDKVLWNRLIATASL